MLEVPGHQWIAVQVLLTVVITGSTDHTVVISQALDL